MAMIEKATYIKGLCDGLELGTASKEGKVITALLDLVTEMATSMDAMQAEINELKDYVEELDEDLGDVEEVLVGDDEDNDEDDDDVCDGDCANCEFDCGADDDEDEDDDGEYFEVVCPACGEIINFDSTIDPENLRCPACGEKFECIVDEEDLKAIDGDEE